MPYHRRSKEGPTGIMGTIDKSLETPNRLEANDGFQKRKTNNKNMERRKFNALTSQHWTARNELQMWKNLWPPNV